MEHYQNLQGSSDASMQDHNNRWDPLIRWIEQRKSFPRSSASLGALLDKSFLALVHTNSSGLSCGA